MQKFSIQERSPLLKYLFIHCVGMKKTGIKQLLKYKSIRVNGQVVTAFDHPLKPGDTVEILGKKASLTEKLKNRPEFSIVFEDNSILVAEKPAGLLTMGTDHEKKKTLYFMLTEYQKAKSLDGHGRLFIVHRLDRDASGLLIFAKGETAKRILQQDWSSATKKYYAITEGTPRQESGVIESHLEEDNFQRVYSTTSASPEAKRAITHYRVLQEAGRYALLDVELETGRKNQIRVHLSEMGHPIVGDEKYGSQSNPLNRLALHAYELSIEHPVTGAQLTFHSPYPESFKRLIDYKPKS